MNDRPKIICQLDNEVFLEAKQGERSPQFIRIEAIDPFDDESTVVYTTKEAFRKWADDVLAMTKEPKP